MCNFVIMCTKSWRLVNQSAFLTPIRRTTIRRTATRRHLCSSAPPASAHQSIAIIALIASDFDPAGPRASQAGNDKTIAFSATASQAGTDTLIA